MNHEMFTQIIDLFEQCQFRGEPLEIDIEQMNFINCSKQSFSLLDFLCKSSFDKFFRFLNDKKRIAFENPIEICQVDENKCRSCHQLHICQNYLLNEDCTQFQLTGQCSRSHSLFTEHNQRILRKYFSHLNNEKLNSLIYRLFQLSRSSNSSASFIVERDDKQLMNDDIIQSYLGEYQTFLVEKKFLDSSTVEFTFVDGEIASMMESLLQQNHLRKVQRNLSQHSNRTRFNSQRSIENSLERSSSLITENNNNASSISNNETNLEIDTSNRQQQIFGRNLGRGRGRSVDDKTDSMNLSSRKNFSTRFTSTSPMLNKSPINEKFSLNAQKSFSFSARLRNSTMKTSNDETQMNSASQLNQLRSPFNEQDSSDILSHCDQTNSQVRLSIDLSDQRQTESTRDTFDCNEEKGETLVQYKYRKPFNDQQLIYLLGPGKEQIRESDSSQIIAYLPLDYCRTISIGQGKQIENDLYSILPSKFHIDLIDLPDDLALLVSTSAGEFIFQQNQSSCAILSESIQLGVDIEIIESSTDELVDYETTISQQDFTSISSTMSNQNLATSMDDNQLNITSTGSSINVIHGDINDVTVDLMICVSTSNKLCQSVLRRAGQTANNQFKARHNGREAILIDGGATKAKKILFVPWQTDFETRNHEEIRQSLSDLVQWCIHQAHQRNMKSISFPPIGTGDLQLDSYFVCETMISAAIERLQHLQLQVQFVIYRSNSNNSDSNDCCYHLFRMYINHLCEQVKSINSSKIINDNRQVLTKPNATRQKIFQRFVQTKRILILSDLESIVIDHSPLIQSLNESLNEHTINILTIDPIYCQDTDELIDACLDHKLLPRLDLDQSELTVRGDQLSIVQLIFNLRNEKRFHQYTYKLIEHQNDEQPIEYRLNQYICMKIDVARSIGQTQVTIEERDHKIYQIDLDRNEIQIKHHSKTGLLYRNLLIEDENQFVRSVDLSSPTPFIIRSIPIESSRFSSLKYFQLFHRQMPQSVWKIERMFSIKNLGLYLHHRTSQSDQIDFYFHSCSYSLVQSIIHYGFHTNYCSNHDEQSVNNLICFTRDPFESHLRGATIATDRLFHLFVVQIAKRDRDENVIFLSNDDAHQALPLLLISYARKTKC